jgi:plastocyanin
MIRSVHQLSSYRGLMAGIAVAALLALAGCGSSSTAATTPTDTAAPAATDTTVAAGNAVRMVSTGSGFAFSPKSLTVPVGTKVTWTNSTTAPHTSTSDDSSAVKWDSGQIQQGGTFSFTFTKAGTYTYHCNVHPSMTATIVVTG